MTKKILTIIFNKTRKKIEQKSSNFMTEHKILHKIKIINFHW